MIPNLLFLLKVLLYFSIPCFILGLIAATKDRKKKPEPERCPACGSTALEGYPPCPIAHCEQTIISSEYQPVRFNIDFLRRITVTPYMRELSRMRTRHYMTCTACGHKHYLEKVEFKDIDRQRTVCPHCKGSHYYVNMSATRPGILTDVITADLSIAGIWHETCPDCGYTEAVPFAHVFNESEVPAAPRHKLTTADLEAEVEKEMSPLHKPKPKKKWTPKQYTHYHEDSFYELVQVEPGRENYTDQCGQSWFKDGNTFRRGYIS